MSTDLADAMAVSLRPVLRAWEAWASDARDAIPRPVDGPHAVADGPSPDRLLLVGAGGAVGWGVVSHELALPGSVARALRAGTGRGAVVDVLADERWGLSDIASALRSASPGRYDVVVVVLGAVDVLSGQTSRAWRDAIHDLLEGWRSTAGWATRLVVLQIPELGDLPGLHGAVVGWAERRANELNAILQAQLATERGIDVLRLPPAPALGLAPDAAISRGDYALTGTILAAALMDDLDRVVGVPVAQRRSLGAADAARNDLLVLALSQHRARLEWIVAVAAAAFRAPSALVTVLGPDRQWHVARTGPIAESVPIQDSFCLYAVELDEPLIVLDAQRDARFADNPLVTAPGGIRFYAGAAIEGADGRPVGAVCVIDREPRTSMTAAERGLLVSLARRAQEVVWAAEAEFAHSS
ncbi:hypothetical protein GCM10009792_00600 [Microcella alkalica]|uniref:GAF domain-containing protein n=1 Tax=Microcella alkalica TaxID=355930 RepID=A0A839E561_9MICO|nr:GAF domain-containing protein [Microcella alkalica]MBA8847799.1 hypothetical protein [Microcella alkalica]